MFSFLRKKSLVKRVALAGAVLVLLTGLLFVSCEQSGGIELGADASLRSLSVDAGTLKPDFSASHFEYSVAVKNAVDSLTVTATANHAKTLVSGHGTKGLSEGKNTIYVNVTAENGSNNTYTIHVTRHNSSTLFIESAEELAKIGVDAAYPLSASYILEKDITLTNNWLPIGDLTKPFIGSFNGNGNKITLNSFDTAQKYLGIFGYVKGSSASAKVTIKDIKIVSQINQVSTKSTGQAIGLIAGYTEYTEFSGITMSGSFNFSTVKDVFAGGIVGWAEKGTNVHDCTSNMNIEIDFGFDAYGKSDLIASTSYSFVGGFVGVFDHEVEIVNCHNTGNIRALSKKSTDAMGTNASIVCGGIGNSYVAYGNNNKQGEIRNCSNRGNVHTKVDGGYWAMPGGIAGGIVGNGSKITGCWASGTVSSEAISGGDYQFVGGITGYPVGSAVVSDCYFTGSVILYQNKSSSTYGLINGAGGNTNGSGGGSVQKSWSNGNITVANVSKGNSLGSPVANSCVALTGPTLTQSEYIAKGWDFDTVWKMGSDGYPHLQWEK
jgi:hypothetical protein